MSDPEFIVLVISITGAIVGLVLAALQFIYRVWDKKDTQTVVAAINASVDSFDPHIERGKRTYGMVKDLKRMHDETDDSGRPMWFMPEEMLETQRELVKLTTILANNQEHTLKLIDRMDIKLDEHKSDCKKQFNQLDKQ